MSSRLFKKVVKEQEQIQQQRQETEEEQQLNDDESESPESGSRPSKNPFDLLNDGDDDPEPEVFSPNINSYYHRYFCYCWFILL